MMALRFALIIAIPAYTFALACLWAAFTPIPQ
jgi:hypothetical protein